MEIVKNLLKKEDLELIQKNLNSESFPWFFGDATSDGKSVQFTHLFHDRNLNTSNYIGLIKPILEKIPAMIYFRIKANLNPKTKKIEETGKHFDVQDKRLKSAIFFVNDCDGYCKIGEKKIFSEANKLLTFNSDEIHTGTSTTNQQSRLVINFVYLPWEKYVG